MLSSPHLQAAHPGELSWHRCQAVTLVEDQQGEALEGEEGLKGVQLAGQAQPLQLGKACVQGWLEGPGWV